MKNILKALIILTAPALLSSCIKEVFPEDGTVTSDQARESLESTVRGLHAFMNKIDVLDRYPNHTHFDFGYPSIMIQREVLGQDLTMNVRYGTFRFWQRVQYQSEDYTMSSMRWYWYYKMIAMCNNIIDMYPDPLQASDADKPLVGIAYTYRAFAYLDLARVYLQGRYIDTPDGATVPIVTNFTSPDEMKNNPRASASEVFALILDDLEMAEACLTNYSRADKNLPDLSVVQGLLARYYLEAGQWADAEQYAKTAQAGYTPLTEAQWRDKSSGFNSPNAAWLWCCSTTSNDDVVQTGIINWASHMSNEVWYGYAAFDYVMIDAHLYSLIPATDFRRNSWVNVAEDIFDTNQPKDYFGDYFSMKFRPGSGDYQNHTVGSSVSVPLMRVEEMMLIEAEAAGRQTLANGKQLLETFVQTYRDPSFVSTSTNEEEFIDEIWIQRRIELWGEGFSTLDLKRLDKPVIRNYAGTNHEDNFRFNSTGAPQWLNLVIPRSERISNEAITQTNNNPDPSMSPGNSPEHVW